MWNEIEIGNSRNRELENYEKCRMSPDILAVLEFSIVSMFYTVSACSNSSYAASYCGTTRSAA